MVLTETENATQQINNVLWSFDNLKQYLNVYLLIFLSLVLFFFFQQEQFGVGTVSANHSTR